MDRFSVGKPKLLASPTADARPCSSARGKRENVRKLAWCFRRPFADGLKSVSVLAPLSQFCKRTPIATRGPCDSPATANREKKLRNPGLFSLSGGVCLAPTKGQTPRPYARFPATGSPGCRRGRVATDCWRAFRAGGLAVGRMAQRRLGQRVDRPDRSCASLPDRSTAGRQILPDVRHPTLVLAAARSRTSSCGRRSCIRGLVHVVPFSAASRRHHREAARQTRRPQLPQRRGTGPFAPLGGRALRPSASRRRERRSLAVSP